MTKWTDKFDMSTIPDDVLHSEAARRRMMKRGEKVGGRPEVLYKCEFCKEKMGYMKLRRHRPRCEKNPNRKDLPV